MPFPVPEIRAASSRINAFVVIWAQGWRFVIGRDGGLPFDSVGLDPHEALPKATFAMATSAQSNGGTAASSFEIIADRARSYSRRRAPPSALGSRAFTALSNIE